MLRLLGQDVCAVDGEDARSRLPSKGVGRDMERVGGWRER